MPGRGKKKKKEVHIPTEEEIWLQKLTIHIEAKLKREIWNEEDRKLKEMGKKLTGKDLIRQISTRKYQLAKAVNAEKMRLINDHREKHENKKREAIAKDLQDREDHEKRVEQLSESCNEIQNYMNAYYEYEAQKLENQNWLDYIHCQGMLDASDVRRMNTYLNMWQEAMDQGESDLEDILNRTEEVIEILEKVEERKDSPVLTASQKESFYDTEKNFKTYQQMSLDNMTYMLLRNIEENMIKDGITVATFEHIHPIIKISLWAMIQLPIPMANPKRPKRPRQEMYFPQMSLRVIFPTELEVWALCLRAMNVTYDHFSIMTKSYNSPELPEIMSLDMFETSEIEWNERLLIMDEFAQKRAQDTGDIGLPILPFDKVSVASQTNLADTVSAVYVIKEDNMTDQVLKSITSDQMEYELNLRKYRVVGGVYFIELFFQPPQPSIQVLRDVIFTTMLLPKQLEQVPYIYNKLQPLSKSSITLALPDVPMPSIATMATLVHSMQSVVCWAKESLSNYDLENCLRIKISLPKTIVWIVEPYVAQWDAQRKIWSSRYVYNIVSDLDKQTVDFKATRFGIFGILLPKYYLLPYEYWSLNPTSGTEVALRIKTERMSVEFTIKENFVCLSEIENIPEGPLHEILHKDFSIRNLKKTMQEMGIDFFPAEDAFNYVKDTVLKNWSMERHTYFGMAQCCLHYRFEKSDWSRKGNRRKIYMVTQELLGLKDTDTSEARTAVITPQRCYHLIEEGHLTEEIRTPERFFADLIHLIRDTSTILVKHKLKKMPPALVYTVALFLSETKILSYS